MKHLITFLFIIFAFFTATAQLTIPPNGANQKSVLTQYIGAIANVTIEYHSPDVTSPQGQDRTGQIWGTLVPYGLNDLGFGLRNPSPWRAGANENTTIEFSHDMLVQGKEIKAGKYGLHLIVQETGPWTIIFSNNSTAWGSFFYDETEDALRVEANPEENEFHEWLTFEFIDRQPNHAVCAFMWENKKLPFTIEVPGNTDLYITKMKQDLQNSAGFSWQSWGQAAAFCLQNNTNLEQGLEWVETAITFSGQGNFSTLSTKAGLLTALNRLSEANKTLMAAVEHPTATTFQIHQLGRSLIAQDRADTALKVFQINLERFDGAWPTHVGMMRGLSALGKYEKALEHAEIALTQAPDQLNKDNLTNLIEKLKSKQDVN